ncbi:hypothetical protein N8A98_22365 [Devosia neptuniae]|uniref:Portal protein n=1 Tax=Devosia neptuniae TaxID=191302 RepID=A0ABY6CCF1_9HYPH|nr:hypothetical protein [Devosia neptuniae]UXN69918.1 hypothetical protein N8A98_22365 [Devosia neptuniae]
MAETDVDDIDDAEGVDGAALAADAKSATGWLNLITESEAYFRDWNERCDNIDKLYANLSKLANTARDREMSLFWANLQTLQPSIYSRPPVPVIMPRFQDRRPIPRMSSELLERSVTVSFETGHLDRTMKLVRNDLARLGRGVLWPRYETKDEAGKGKKVCVDFKFRRDFVHDMARCWAEVGWVAGAGYLTKKEMRKRFLKHSGDVYQSATYSTRKDVNGDKLGRRLTAKVWELWSKTENKVVWVTEGCDKVLDEAKPHLTLDDFFPCPEPAYGTRQPESLVPVPDVMQYRDQLEEINELTARMAALSEAVKVRGFYPSGAGELGDAIEAAVKAASDNVVLIPISNWAATGDGAAKDFIVWWPIDQIVSTIAQLIKLRQQLIQDVYEVSGISDILRGATNPNETLGAQELKAQTGSVRIRDRQDEMVRVSRDVTRIHAEIMAEEFDSTTLLDMAQMQMPTDADVAKQVKALEDQAKRMKAAVDAEMAKPETQAMAQQNPEEAQKAIEEAMQKGKAILDQVNQLKATVTIDQVMKLLKDQRLRPFVLDIETDSTIVPDENAQKQRATEYITSMTGLFAQLVPAVQQVPQIAPVAGQMINYINGVFRTGRQFAQVIEEFTDQMKGMASQPKGPPPEQVKQDAEAKAAEAKAQIEATTAQADAQKTAAEAERTHVENAERMQALQSKQQREALELQIKEQEAADASRARNQDIADKAALAELQRVAQKEKHDQEMEKGSMELAILQAKVPLAEATAAAGH